jgi:hypothetical protein
MALRESKNDHIKVSASRRGFTSACFSTVLAVRWASAQTNRHSMQPARDSFCVHMHETPEDRKIGQASVADVILVGSMPVVAPAAMAKREPHGQFGDDFL